MADHLDAPGLMPPGGNPSTDITDVYAFRKSASEDKSILIMNVNPLVLSAAFDMLAMYELKVDTDGDALEDIAFRFKFSTLEDGSQTAAVRRATAGMARQPENVGDVIIADAPVSFGKKALVTTSGDFTVFAGLRSDPFFFDLAGFLAGFSFPSAKPPKNDFFRDKNVFGIALEVPNSALGSNPSIGVWGRVLMPENGNMVQIDRMGRPAINTVFNKGEDKNLFNRTSPVTDRARFTGNVVAFLTNFYSEEAAKTLANVLLPDILTYNYSSTDGFLNGRKLTDDVIDIELSLVTNMTLTTDFAPVHTDLLNEFPFMGSPH